MINYLLDEISIGRDNWYYDGCYYEMIAINTILTLLLMDKHDNKVHAASIHYCSLYIVTIK